LYNYKSEGVAVTEELQTVSPQDSTKAAYPLVRGGFNFCDDSYTASRIFEYSTTQEMGIY